MYVHFCELALGLEMELDLEHPTHPTHGKSSDRDAGNMEAGFRDPSIANDNDIPLIRIIQALHKGTYLYA